MPHYIKISIYDNNKMEKFRETIYWIKQEGNVKKLRELHNMWINNDDVTYEKFLSIDMENPLTKKQLMLLIKSNIMQNYKIFNGRLKTSIAIKDNPDPTENMDDTIELLNSLQYHEDDFFITHK